MGCLPGEASDHLNKGRRRIDLTDYRDLTLSILRQKRSQIC